MEWGDWCGRFSKEKQKNVYSRIKPVAKKEMPRNNFWVYHSDTETWFPPILNKKYTDKSPKAFNAVLRHRQVMFNDFRARMDWCVIEYNQANHNTVGALNGNVSDDILHLNASPNDIIGFDASASTDPGGDNLQYNWWIYPEAGTYVDDVKILLVEKHHVQVKIPEDATGT